MKFVGDFGEFILEAICTTFFTGTFFHDHATFSFEIYNEIEGNVEQLHISYLLSSKIKRQIWFWHSLYFFDTEHKDNIEHLD